MTLAKGIWFNLPNFFRAPILLVSEFSVSSWLWAKRGYGFPVPSYVKRKLLKSLSFTNAIWIETGTLHGDMTKFLAKSSDLVISIEPSELLSTRAKKRFRNNPNVSIIQGTSEDYFSDVVKEVSGRVNFFLDGHFSGVATFQGDRDTPIQLELEVISAQIGRLEAVAVFIDDVRLFPSGAPETESDYPSRDYLINWACGNNLRWDIQHDIFIAISSDRLHSPSAETLHSSSNTRNNCVDEVEA